MTHGLRFSPLISLLMLGACTTLPTAPSVMALPGAGKTLTQFRADDYECRQFASVEAGGRTSNQVSNSGTDRAAIATPAGAEAGAATNGRKGPALSAGTGLVAGAAAGTSAAADSTYDAQRSYDGAYMQCMYAKGHKVPVGGALPSVNPPADYTPLYPPPPR